MNKLHLCCNQRKSRWEVLDNNNQLIVWGTLEECEEFINIVK